jgi:hypothetical protein
VKEEKKKLEPAETKEPVKVQEQKVETEQEIVEKIVQQPTETDKTNYGGIGIVGEHIEINRFKALAKYHKGTRPGFSIGRALIEALRAWNEKNPM